MLLKIKSLTINLLRKTQKLTGTDNIYIAKHGSYVMIENIVSMAASFLLSIAFARLLPQETFGQYRYILSIMALLAIFSLEGINNAVIQGVAKKFEGAFKKGFNTKLKWSLFGSLGSIIIAVYFWLQGNIEFTISFLIIAVFLPFFKSGMIYQSYLSGKKLFGTKANYVSIIQCLSAASLIITLFLTKSLIILILVYFVSYSLLRMFFLFWTIKKHPPNKINNSKIISYGKHLSLMRVIGLISQQIDKVLVFHFIGPIQLAIYSFAILPIRYIRSPLQAIQELALPKLSIRTSKDIKKTLPKKLLKASFLILLIIIIYIILAPYFYKIFYPTYPDSVLYSQLFAFTLLVFPASMLTLSLQAKMKTKELYKISITNQLSRIALFIILIPLYGLLGVIMAMLLTQVLHFFLAWFFFKKI